MAHRYREQRVQDGDFVSYADWNRFHGPYVEEINGGIDRDNVPLDAVATALIKSNGFSRTLESAYVTTLVLNGDRVDWQDGDGSTYIGRKADVAPCDSLISATWNGSFDNGGTLGNTSFLDIRMLINGQEVARSDKHDLYFREHDSTSIDGQLVVPAGPWVVEVQAWWRDANGAATEQDMNFNERVLLVRERRR